MQRLTHKIDFDEDQKPPKLPYVKYTLRQLKVNSVVPFDPIHIREIGFLHSDALAVENLLRNCQNLRTLHLPLRSIRSCCTFSTAVKIDLPNLAHMTVCVCQLPRIQSRNIVSLSLHCFCHRRNIKTSEVTSQHFGKFLSTCRSLKHLTFDGFYANQIQNIDNQLESLFILNTDGESSFKCKRKLFESQRASLKNLIIGVNYADDDVPDFIYQEMSLEKLSDRRLSSGELTESKNVKIKNLKFCEYYKFPFVQKLFSGCHDLEILSINLIEGKELETLEMISQLPKLKRLTLIGSFNHECNIQFPELEELRWYFHNDHTSIVYGCPKLKRLRMRVRLTKSNFEKIFDCCSNIEEIDLISMNSDEIVTEEMVEAIEFAASKVTIKCEVSKCEVEKFAHLKNRSIITPAIYW